jgi:hypothetical protein
MEPIDTDEILLLKIRHFVKRNGTTGGIKMAKHNRSGNGRGARVVLRAYPTYR